MKKVLTSLLIIFIYLSPINVFAKDTAIKGDIYNPQNNTISSTSSTITSSKSKVDIEKRVTKVNDDGLYNISFWIRGDITTNAVPKDTYIVFVIDRSYTMGTNNRWNEAKSAVISISKQLSSIDKVKMALVGFSGGKSSKSIPWDDTITLREKFSSSSFTENEFGNYDTDKTHYGGTNIQGGLLKAEELLKNKLGNKYIILLSDGVPTFYYDESGNTKGPGNSDTKDKIKEVPDCRDAAIEVANRLKEDTTIYTIGYDLNNLTNEFTYNNTNYNEKNLAIETLTGIATKGKYLTASTTSNNTIATELQKIGISITTYYAGSNPSITDNLGSNFKLTTSTNYGTTKELNTNEGFIIDSDYKEIGNFNINIDTSVDNGWYKTNNNFILTYTDETGTNQTLKVTDNPEVYWKNKYNYQVNYYFNNIYDKTLTIIASTNYNNIIKAEDNYLESSSLSNKNNQDNKTYILDTTNPSNTSSIIIDTNEESNILNIYYISNPTLPLSKIIVHYITKDNIKLTDSIEITGQVGEAYQTTKKSFPNYSFINLLGEPSGYFNEDITEVFYIYDLNKLPPKTSDNIIKVFIISCLSILGIIILKKKITKL